MGWPVRRTGLPFAAFPYCSGRVLEVREEQFLLLSFRGGER
ncbi:hypothetical protein [Streptomyces levis]